MGASEELRFHVETDSSMGRGGVRPEHLSDVVSAIDATPGAVVAGIWSHLADGRDSRASGTQLGSRASGS